MRRTEKKVSYCKQIAHQHHSSMVKRREHTDRVRNEFRTARDKMRSGAERICAADLNGDNLRINRTYLRISDYCRVTVRVTVREYR